MEPVVGFDLALPSRGSRALLRAVHAQLRAHILARRLQPGTLLPSSRQLAAAFGFSRNTAVAVYDLLASEGYVLTRAGGGTYVAAVAQATATAANASTSGDARLHPQWRQAAPFGFPHDAGEPVYDFSVGQPDESLFPFDVWRRLSARAARDLSRQPAHYAAPAGLPALREAVARHVSFTRAVACSADDVIVCAGAQQAFDLLARVLVTPGRTLVAVEDPGYGPLRAAFQGVGARLAGVPLDAEGLRVDRIPPQARVVCVTPSHQFPLGMALSAERRRALLEAAHRQHAVVVEDDYDGEFRYGARPLDALQTLDRAQCVFYVGTFSKTMFPGLRLGYLVAPPWARPALLAAKQAMDWHCALQAQATLAAFIADGHLVRHVRRTRRRYGERRAALLQGLARHLGGLLQPLPAEAGLHLACATADARTAQQLEAAGLRLGLQVTSLARYAFGRPYAPGPLQGQAQGLALGFARVAAPRIDEALARLAQATRR